MSLLLWFVVSSNFKPKVAGSRLLSAERARRRCRVGDTSKDAASGRVFASGKIPIYREPSP
jgi:hypothetical protein